MLATLDAQALFDASPNAYMVLDRDLRYVAANQAYLDATHASRDELIGVRITDRFPHDPDDPNNEQLRMLVASFERVFATGQRDALPYIHYRIRIDGAYQDRYWSATHTPIFGADGQVEHVLQHTVDVTNYIRAKHSGDLAVQAGVFDRARDVQERNQALGRELHGLLSLFEQAPGLMAFVRGPNHVFELCNPAYRHLVGNRDVIGMRVRDALPEVGERFFTLLDHVYASGETFVGTAVPVMVENAQRVTEERILDFVYQPVRDGSGAVIGILVVGHDVSDAVRAERDREAMRAELLAAEKAARAEAERATSLMDQFLATVSHELRTPLTAILGWMSMLRTGTLNPEKRERALEIVERNAQVQAQLVDDLLDVSRILSGKLTIEMQPTDVAAAVVAAVETVRPAADAKRVQLEVAIDANATVTGDSARLQQVVWNLLSNAVKFTPAQGSVQVRVEQSGGEIEIAVTDTGSGIAPEFLPHVFERFRQAEGGSARKLGGLGLGLSIVQHVVHAHGGRVTAHSDGVGKGATFRVLIPTVRQASVRTWAPSCVPIAPAALRGTRVLVVDDEADTRDYVRALLEGCEANVTVAGTADDAMVALMRERPDVVVSDLGMPGEDGYALIRRVRALPADKGGRTPAIALTAYARREDRARAMLAGFQNHVPKPVEPSELVAVVASLAPQQNARA